MNDQHLSRAMCYFVPPHILHSIVNSSDAPAEAHDAAKKTLSADKKLREQRATALTSGEDPLCPGTDIPVAQVPIVSRGFVPASILEQVAQSDLADDETRESVRATLRSDAKIRQQRAGLVGRAARDEQVPLAGALELRRAIHNGNNGNVLPGRLARGEGAPRTRERQVDYAYEGVGITLKFFHTVFGRNAVDGNGNTPVLTVHHDPDTTLGYNNAFWNGKQFAFGDGDGIIFDHFADSLDVIAHELTHAITQYTARIAYFNQAGGLNESISDVFAAMVEQWYFNQTAAEADWLVGQNIFALGTKGAALRNIANPGTAFNDPLLGRDNQISHYKDYRDGLGVHDTSGIPNRAFYLTAMGFGGYSWAQAGQIWYATLTDTRVRRPDGIITFREWADVTVDQATRLFGIRAANIVRNAWISVGVIENAAA